MRKSIITPGGQDAVTPAEDWLHLDRLVRVAVTSEDSGHPIECARTARRPANGSSSSDTRSAGSPGTQSDE